MQLQIKFKQIQLHRIKWASRKQKLQRPLKLATSNSLIEHVYTLKILSFY
jgi:hypothetical protein